MNSIDKLSEMFSKFPGIGPRQAKRFVYFLLTRDGASIDTLIRGIENLKKEIVQCKECMRYFPEGETFQAPDSKICSVCSNKQRDESLLMVVPRDMDLEAVEKSGSYNGHYFVLGGSLPVLEKSPQSRIRIKELKDLVGRKVGLKEVVLAMNANVEGENTAEYIREELKDTGLEISILGRGLSTGAELEYADPETLKNAFLHRTK